MSRTMITLISKQKSLVLNSVRRFSLELKNTDGLKSLEDVFCYDLAIIGGGIIGTSIAREIKTKSPASKIILIEKESCLGKHQSSHNSGVIHSGIYYKPGSLKAAFCVKGKHMLQKYCDENNIPYKNTGKLVTATDTNQIDILNTLHSRGLQNGVEDLSMLKTIEEINEVEPRAKGFQALYSAATGNVDFQCVTNSFGKDFRKIGGDILFSNEVKCIKASSDCDFPILIKCNENLFLKTKYIILAGGLHSGTLLDLIDTDEAKRCGVFISFRVNYHLLKNGSITRNIYAVPDMSMPFLGIHMSPRLDGSTLLGPTAVPAYQIEGYKADELNLSYLKHTLSSPHFQNMTKRHFSKCVDQLTKHFFPSIQLKELKKLARINEADITKGPVGVQVQLVNEDGGFEDDFVFEIFEGEGISKRIIKCVFVPSPGATSCMAIAENLAGKFFEQCPNDVAPSS